MPACEAIIALGEPLTYHEEGVDADGLVHSFFRASSDILPAGGMLIFDVIELGDPSLAGRYWSSGEDWVVLAETEEDQSSRTLVRRIETFRRVDHFYGVEERFTEYGSSTLQSFLVNWLRAGFQRRLPMPTALTSLLLAAVRFSPLAWATLEMHFL
jgi:hypothetical protein